MRLIKFFFSKSLKITNILATMITIKELKEATIDALDGINNLLPQLSSSAQNISIERLSELVLSDNSIIFLGFDESGQILGMLSLIIVKIPTGNKAWIEDVVVDQMQGVRVLVNP